MKKVVDNILKFHRIKLVILVVLILFFFILYQLFYVACVYGSFFSNSSYIHYYEEPIKCYASENFHETNELLCTNEECLNLRHDGQLFCVNERDEKCLKENTFPSLMLLISLVLLVYLITIILYSTIKVFTQKTKKKS